ncbi:hypothetical protein CBR_g40798 [Chara braunii]|uniref:Nudix hydrolase domain-containing protein n=1 Tax=Chara braunii TaxID=69332 RepID=A0A388LUI8_CHABU|nr:hypothetical protein CBR_g40798 [Chara braunii]|eukprot:GBG85986.1 hypothetical protein CBR_g40798 [Chara braunii]
MRVSVILPVLNEEKNIARAIESTRCGTTEGAEAVPEVIVVDGGSNDQTVTIARSMGVNVLQSPRGRGPQMNAGAQAANGDVLLFLHGDSSLPPGYIHMISSALRLPMSSPSSPLATSSVAQSSGTFGGTFGGGGQTSKRQVREWGAFVKPRIDASGWGYRVLETLILIRTRVFYMPYGDQGLFIRRDTFGEIGGYPSMPIMEDFELVRRLKRRGPPGLISGGPLLISARRWEERGIVETTIMNQVMILGYFIGVSPSKLADLYRSRPLRKLCSGLCVARRCLPSGCRLRPGVSGCGGGCGHGSGHVTPAWSAAEIYRHRKANGFPSPQRDQQRSSLSAAAMANHDYHQEHEEEALHLQQQRPEIIWSPHGIGWDCGIMEDDYWLCPEMRRLALQLREYRPSGVDFLASVEGQRVEEEEEEGNEQAEGGRSGRRRGSDTCQDVVEGSKGGHDVGGDVGVGCPKTGGAPSSSSSSVPSSTRSHSEEESRGDDAAAAGRIGESDEESWQVGCSRLSLAAYSSAPAPCASAAGATPMSGLLVETPAATKGKRVRTLCRVKKNAAVLVPLFRRNGELRVLLTKRASAMTSHSGEVALPGGKRDEGDSDDAATALREAFEEIGLPPAKVRVVARLEPFLSKHLLTVSPVVGLLPSTGVPKLQLNEEEVETVFDMPLETFLKEDAHMHDDLEWLGLPYRVHHFWHDCDGVRFHVWGLTAAILIRAAAVVFQRPSAFKEFHPAVPDYASVLRILAQRRLLQL